MYVFYTGAVMSSLEIVRDNINLCVDTTVEKANKYATPKNVKSLKKGLQLGDYILEMSDKLSETSNFLPVNQGLKGSIQTMNWLGSKMLLNYWTNPANKIEITLEKLSMACLTINVFGKMALSIHEAGSKMLESLDHPILNELGKKAAEIGTQYPLLKELEEVSLSGILKKVALAGSIFSTLDSICKAKAARGVLDQAQKEGDPKKINEAEAKLSKAYWSLGTNSLDLISTLAGIALMNTHPITITLGLASKGVSFYQAVWVD
jgi:hypothetical protein